jgi:hypothetical protein
MCAVAGCGGPSIDGGQALRDLAAAMERPVSSPDETAEHSRIVERALDSEVLMDKTRQEVLDAIGRGDDCSRHPKCAENGFAVDDWFYTVGTMGEGRAGVLPILIVGFDRTGRVTRVWNMRTHDDP